MERKIKTVTLSNNKQLCFETGKVAKQANGSVIVTCGETIVFSTACASPLAIEEGDFLPLKVDYFEKFFSAGKTLGGFIKREGKLTEREILISRLTDRSIRPMFENGYTNEVQVLSYVWSYDGLNSPDPLAITAAAAALVISDIPLIKPIAGVRVGYVNGTFIINPCTDEMKDSKLDLMLAGTEDAILMIEGHADFLTEEEVLAAIAHGQEAITTLCHAMHEWRQEVGKEKNRTTLRPLPQEVLAACETLIKEPLQKSLRIMKKQERDEATAIVQKDLLAALFSQEPPTHSFSQKDVKASFKQLSSKYMREMILEEGLRSDGRKLNEIRAIDIEAGLLPRAHGSCLFTRGETQTLAVCTLGGESMSQRYEDLNGEGASRFYLQYFFPPFSVGEVGRMGPPGRREVGHGKLAERALQYAIPPMEEFPYAVRLESNITESNGSSSMASICGGCLAMMDAGVPLKRVISGIAMGLILEDSRVAILSDILGVEDALGDMDFKIAGDGTGITAFQMDIKVEGITLEIMKKALTQAKEGRIHILNKMLSCLAQPKKEMSIYAPRIETIQVKQNKIATIIGPGGKQIRSIIEETGVQIDINDSGLVSIASTSQEGMLKARKIIEGLIGEVEVNKVYHGKVTSVVPFGVFVELLPGKEGLCHISELSPVRIQNINEHIKVGDHLDVKVLRVNDRGQYQLSHKATKEAECV